MTLIKSLLDQWQTEAEGEESRSEAAVHILEEAEHFITQHKPDCFQNAFWHQFLNVTRKSSFLTALPTDVYRYRWAELVFKIIRLTNFTLKDLMVQRVEEHPKKILFKDMTFPVTVEWTYEQILRHIREMAAVFFKEGGTEPRVAIFSDNCLEGACSDLACLSFNIFVTPLSTHFSAEILLTIFDQLQITIAVADSKERIQLLQQVQQKTAVPFRIFSLLPHGTLQDVKYLPEECKKVLNKEIEQFLDKNPSLPNNRVATTMFTSGSTGLPKGVSFSIYQIVTKRFARAAALPSVGEETFLCYLPLFHTFGRYLEMTGAIFWSGTYVFAGNTSAETLLSLFPKVNPTGFISIPLRWQELYEKCQAETANIESDEIRHERVREVTGHQLNWGLSAAGYLDPGVFRFFNEYGIHLNSGFGMTEATGGITMTPPGKYKDSSVGIPLPGVYTRLTAVSELEISGHYIAAYLEEAGPGDTIPYPVSPETDRWLSTGDVFRIAEDGYFEIIDRVKDIYKNNRGQTVAPQVIEKKFLHVPGIKNTFVVGDNRPYNVLLIVPDLEDPLFQSITGDNINEYFHQITMSANLDVAPYERVVNFSLLPRNFSGEKGELTPKGSFNRKSIEKNFSELIETLYISNIVTIKTGDLVVTIPRWFYRDLGILENDILFEKDQLINRRTKQVLTLKMKENNLVLLGDLVYRINSDTFDLGVFARQPRLWIANPELIAFCPIKESWDIPLGAIASSVYVSTFKGSKYRENNFLTLKAGKDENLSGSNRLITEAFFLPFEEAYIALDALGKLFSEAEPRLAEVLRHRLEALAFHPEEEMRALAYRIILLKSPDPEQIPFLPAFIESGLSFLNENSIREIASSNFGKHRLDALKRRLYWYRNHLHWPGGKKTKEQFGTILQLLFNFATLHLEFYTSIRSELSRWILHRKDPFLSRKAEEYFNRLALVFEQDMEERMPRHSYAYWRTKMVFESGIPATEQERLASIFSSTTFFHESIALAFNDPGFDLTEVPDRGIWVLRLQAFKDFKHYRISVNTMSGKHFDLHMVMSENPDFIPKPETFYWMASMSGFPTGPIVTSQLGSSRPTLGILSTQYIGGLTAWDKIREFSEIHKSAGYLKPNAWKKVFVKSFSVIFRAWQDSGYQIVPGVITPSNIMIPEMDFRESAVIVTLTGWSLYKNPLSLVNPMLQDFYCRTAALYPACKKNLDVNWIFDACIETFGKEEARGFLELLRSDLKRKPFACYGSEDVAAILTAYLDQMQDKTWLPLAMISAIDQYNEWHRMNPGTTALAKEQTLVELMELYKLQQYEELVRYHFYRKTYFLDAIPAVIQAFDKLLEKMESGIRELPIQLLELSELQTVITEDEDKDIFSRMVFPKLRSDHRIDFMKVGENKGSHVVVRLYVEDKSGTEYIMREPLEPREIGQLYQLFYRENYPKEVSDSDSHFIVEDRSGKIVAGLIWHYLDEENVLLDGIAVTSSLQGKGIASSMIENFFASMSARGVKVIKAHFLFGNYYLKHFFEVDKKWGALIKNLET